MKKKIVKVLASAEFYDLDTQQWEMVGSMQVIRTMDKKSTTETKNREKEQRDGIYNQGCISCGPCSYPELTEDHVLPSAQVKIFRTVTRNAVNKSV